MIKKKIALLPGDGIGPEVTSEAVKALKAIEEKGKISFEFIPALIGAAAIYKTGNPLPHETLGICRSCDAVLFGAIGSPEFDNDPSAKVRPEQGLLKLRKKLELFANIRPVKTIPSLAHLSPLKKEIVEHTDFVVYRELTGGIYFGKKYAREDGLYASDLCEYNAEEISRIAVLAFAAAEKRRKKVTLVDKANVLETSRLWRKTVQQVAEQFPGVCFETLFVDNAAMKIIQSPSAFDVILTENMFGDILTDEASVIPGSLGLMPSASVGKGVSLYEPIHGSYPQAAGKGIANPAGAILSAAMMLDLSFGMKEESKLIETAVFDALSSGMATPDVNPAQPCSTGQFGSMIAEMLQKSLCV